ncbi:MAG: hypothetical protein K9W42_10795 [Candidatus Heimdallarchaeota archaeon]|nr:hypothetical protein [Candidatus Heimdallarchaeota archaeon]
MTEKEQSLASKIIKILRVTEEPISAHAISKTYKLSNAKVKRILTELEEDKLIYGIKTARGKFYFMPDKYFKREKNFLDSDEIPPITWYEELSDLELKQRKEKILEQIERLKRLFQETELSAEEYFKKFQAKNEEISIINQILEDRWKKRKRCYYCGEELQEENEKCPSCKKSQPVCIVCKRSIYGNEEWVRCPECGALAHKVHLLEWSKTIGTCPNCKKKLNPEKLVKQKEKAQ